MRRPGRPEPADGQSLWMVRVILWVLLLAGVAGAEDLRVCVSAHGGPWEVRAAQDLALYIGKMTGVPPEVGHELSAARRNLVVGELALRLRPGLRQRLAGVAKPDPVLRADAIALQSEGRDLYLAGSNDDSHYFAVAELLRRWGCRWYLPTDLGECIPHHSLLPFPTLDYAYAPPFEVRAFWYSANGNASGSAEFAHRNFLNCERVPCAHNLNAYLKQLKDPKLSTLETARGVAQLCDADFGKGESISLSMEDGLADADSKGELHDKFFGVPVLTDVFLTFYNRVAEALLEAHPHSRAKIGFLAYTNLTLPPQKVERAARPLVCYLAPIDIDPNHAMSDPRSPSRRDYREMMRGWSRVMEGRVVIYDYDQGMLIWRDLPNPSQHVLARDIGEYRRAGILGIDAEDRGAYATTFLNEYFRGQLYWNPDLDVDRELAEFYPAFYGPAAGPMAQYWTEIFQAWKDTSVTEHEFFVIPAVYPRSLVERLGKAIGQAGTPPEPYATRVQVARLSYQLLDAYTAMVEAACAQCDYTTASGAGARGLEIRGQLKKLSPILVNEFMESKTPPWWAGELAIYEGLAHLSEGPRGKLVVKTPLHWDYRPDPWDHGLWRDWARDQEAQGWQSVRTDLYLQAQPAILTQEFESPGGFGYYRCKLHLTREQVKGAVHVAFPGIFNDSWLYVNGKLLANRPQKTQWWANDYSFSWDVDLSERLQEGDNWLCVRTRVPQHLAGIFRRPFLYRLESP